MVSDLKDKITHAGFSQQELFGFKHQLCELKKIYHPSLTQKLTLPRLIQEEAKKSIISTWYYIVAIFVSIIAVLIFGQWSYLYMPVGILFFALLDIYSSAREASRTVKCQIKLMALAVKLKH